MNTRYFLPATVAASLHLVAFFGFTRTDCPPVRPEKEPAVDALPPVPVIIRDIEEVPVDPLDKPPPGPKGEPVELRPGLDEPVEKVPGDFTIPSEPVARNRVDVTRIIAPAVVGLPNGDGDGPGAGTGTFDLRALDNEPRARVRVAPKYPGELRMAGVEGEVLVGFVINESGDVAHAWVVRSSDRRFEEATLRAVERWRFEPGKKNGRAVRFRMEVPVNFRVSE